MRAQRQRPSSGLVLIKVGAHCYGRRVMTILCSCQVCACQNIFSSFLRSTITIVFTVLSPLNDSSLLSRFPSNIFLPSRNKIRLFRLEMLFSVTTKRICLTANSSEMKNSPDKLAVHMLSNRRTDRLNGKRHIDSAAVYNKIFFFIQLN